MPNPHRRSCASLATSFAIFVLGACANHGDVDRPPDRAACERYREHLIDLRLDGVTDDRDAHRAAVAASLGADVVDRCLTELAPAELDCLTRATTLDAARDCSKEP